MALVLIPLFLLAMYFAVLRPQQQRIRAQQALVASLVVGDEVISSAGIFGTVVALDDDVAHLQVADGVVLRIARMAIARRVTDDGGDNDPDGSIDLTASDADRHDGAATEGGD